MNVMNQDPRSIARASTSLSPHDSSCVACRTPEGPTSLRCRTASGALDAPASQLRLSQIQKLKGLL